MNNMKLALEIQAKTQDAAKAVDDFVRKVTGMGTAAETAGAQSVTASKRQTSALNDVSRALSRQTETVDRAARSQKGDITGLVAKLVQMRAEIVKTGPAWSVVGQKASSAIGSIKSQVFSIQGALSGIGVVGIASDFLDTAAAFENLELSLETVTGSSAQAKESMVWISDFTASTPYELENVATAFKQLAAYGLEPTKYLRVLGDTSASMGKDLMQAVEAFSDAATGEFERLKEFGIRTSVVGDQVTFSWVQNGKQMERVVQKTGTAITTALSQIWSDRYSGGMDRLSKGWSGLWSNLRDQVTLFEKDVMDAGVLDWMKDELTESLQKLSAAAKDGSLKQTAQDIGGNVVGALSALKSAFTDLTAVYDTIPDGLGLMIFGAAWGGAQGGLAGAGAGAAIGGSISLLGALKQSLEGFQQSMSGEVSFWDYMWADRQELEILLDQADAARKAKNVQIFQADSQRVKTLAASHKQAAEDRTTVESESAAKVQAIQQGLTALRKTEWDKLEKTVKEHLQDMLREEEKYAARVKALDEKRRLAQLTGEEKVRAMLRTTMTESEAYQDKQNEASQSLQKMYAALSAGDGGQAEFWAEKAADQFADLNSEVKDGERVVVSAAEAQATAVNGVREAYAGLDRAYQAQRDHEVAGHKERQALIQQDEQKLKNLKAIQDTISEVEVLITAEDGATPTLENLQLASSKLAQLNMQISATDKATPVVTSIDAKTGELLDPKILAIKAKDQATEPVRLIETATGKIITNKAMTVSANDQATEPVRLIETETGKIITNKSVDVTVNDQTAGPVRIIETEFGRIITNKNIDVTATDKTEQVVADVAADVARVPEEKTTELTALGNATAVLADIQRRIDALADKTVTITVNYETNGSAPSSANATSSDSSSSYGSTDGYESISWDSTSGGYGYALGGWPGLPPGAVRLAGGGDWLRIWGKVHGPGTTTSDSVRAYLSREEFVVRAAAQQAGSAVAPGFWDAANAVSTPAEFAGLISAVATRFQAPQVRMAGGGSVSEALAGAVPVGSHDTMTVAFQVGGKEYPVEVAKRSKPMLTGVLDELDRAKRLAGR